MVGATLSVIGCQVVSGHCAHAHKSLRKFASDIIDGFMDNQPNESYEMPAAWAA
jgi:hypothetical protein